MLTDLDPWYSEQWSVVHEGEAATGLDPVPEPLLFATLADVRAVGVAKRKPDGAAFGSSLPKEIIEAWVRLVDEDGRVDEDVDVPAGLSEDVRDRGDRKVGALLIQ